METLPNELLCAIYAQLDDKSVLALRICSKTAHEAAPKSVVYRFIHKHKFKLVLNAIKHIKITIVCGNIYIAKITRIRKGYFTKSVSSKILSRVGPLHKVKNITYICISKYFTVNKCVNSKIASVTDLAELNHCNFEYMGYYIYEYTCANKNEFNISKIDYDTMKNDFKHYN